MSDNLQQEIQEKRKHQEWYLDRHLMAPGKELSVHGLRLGFRRKFPLIIRFGWLLLFVVFLLIFVVLIFQEFIRFYDIPKRAVVMRQRGPLPFPSVSICNMNPYKQSEMKNVPELLAVESYLNDAADSDQQQTDFIEKELADHPHQGLKRCDPISTTESQAYLEYEDPRKMEGTKVTIHCYATHTRPQESSDQVTCVETENGEVAWNGGENIDLCTLKKCDTIERTDQWDNRKIEYEDGSRAHGTYANVSCLNLYKWMDDYEDPVRTSYCLQGKWKPELECESQCYDLEMKGENLNTTVNATVIDSADTTKGIMDADLSCNNGIWLAQQYEESDVEFWDKAYESWNEALEAIEYPCLGLNILHGTVLFQEQTEEQVGYEEIKWEEITLAQMKAAPMTTPTSRGQMVSVKCDGANNWIFGNASQGDSQSFYCVFQSRNVPVSDDSEYKASSELELKYVQEGQDNPKPPTCIKICDPLPQVENMNNENITYIKDGVMLDNMAQIPVGTVASVMCNEDYTVVPTEPPTCYDDGKWSPLPKCLKYCQTIEVQNGQIIPFNMQNVDKPPIGTSFKVYCNKGEDKSYTFDANTKLLNGVEDDGDAYELLTCSENGEYDLEIPKCVVQCKKIILEDGNVYYEHERRKVNTQARINCNNDDELLIGSNQLTCQEDGKWNFWEGRDPYCLKMSEQLLQMFDVLANARKTGNAQVLQSKLEEVRVYMIQSVKPETLTKIGHGLEMIKSCAFDKKNCEESQFNTFSDMFLGNCHQYTAWDENGQIQNSTRPGPRFGLSLRLNINQSEYMQSTRRTGIHIIVHKYNQTVSTDASGFSIPMGLHTSLALRYAELNRKDEPMGACINIKQPPSTFYYKTEYSVMGCYNSCRQRLLLNLCSCGDPHLPFPPNENRTCTLEKRSCLDEKNELFTAEYLNKECACRPPCTEIEFKQTAHYAKWPAKKALERYCGLESKSEQKRKECIETFSQTNAVVEIYYNLIEKEILIEEVAYTLSSLLSDIGSQMSIWMGLSILTVIELFMLVPRYWHAVKEKRRLAQMVQDNQE